MGEDAGLVGCAWRIGWHMAGEYCEKKCKSREKIHNEFSTTNAPALFKKLSKYKLLLLSGMGVERSLGVSKGP